MNHSLILGWFSMHLNTFTPFKYRLFHDAEPWLVVVRCFRAGVFNDLQGKDPLGNRDKMCQVELHIKNIAFDILIESNHIMIKNKLLYVHY